MNVYRGVHELIGHTPIVEITRFSLPKGVRLFAKLEFYNPGGSVKDRLGRELIEDALEKGLVTGVEQLLNRLLGILVLDWHLALEHDLRVIVCVPEKFSIEKQELMKALGATVVHTPTEQGMTGAIAKAKELVNELPNSYSPSQFANEANPRAYFKTLGPELWDALNGEINIFVAGAGTGGTFMGTASYLKEKI